MHISAWLIVLYTVAGVQLTIQPVHILLIEEIGTAVSSNCSLFAQVFAVYASMMLLSEMRCLLVSIIKKNSITTKNKSVIYEVKIMK